MAAGRGLPLYREKLCPQYECPKKKKKKKRRGVKRKVRDRRVGGARWEKRRICADGLRMRTWGGRWGVQGRGEVPGVSGGGGSTPRAESCMARESGENVQPPFSLARGSAQK